MVNQLTREGRIRPMKVLCLGFGRTGTISLREALFTLGYHHVYHTFDTIRENNQTEWKMWYEFLCAKGDGVGRLPGRQDFDAILGHCQAVLDMPAAYFADELIAAYPDAKVILNKRDVDSWYNSVLSTLQSPRPWTFHMMRFNNRLLLMPSRWWDYMVIKLNDVLYRGDFVNSGKRVYTEHYEHIKTLVPPENLLEYHVKEGWEPLCKFLDKSIPEGDIPRLNSREEFTQDALYMHNKAWNDQFRRVLDISAYTVLAVTVVSVVAKVLPRGRFFNK